MYNKTIQLFGSFGLDLLHSFNFKSSDGTSIAGSINDLHHIDVNNTPNGDVKNVVSSSTSPHATAPKTKEEQCLHIITSLALLLFNQWEYTPVNQYDNDTTITTPTYAVSDR
eukprot:UN08313